MKQFLLFHFEAYYPNGGWSDFKRSFDTIEKADNYIRVVCNKDYAQIVDLELGKMIKQYHNGEELN